MTSDAIVDLHVRYPFDLAEQTRHDYARQMGEAYGLLPPPAPGPARPECVRLLAAPVIVPQVMHDCGGRTAMGAAEGCPECGRG